MARARAREGKPSRRKERRGGASAAPARVDAARLDRALDSRADHLKANRRSLSMRDVRRLLERDMDLAAGILDTHPDMRQRISQRVDSLLEGPKCKKVKRSRTEDAATSIDPSSLFIDPDSASTGLSNPTAALGLGRLPNELLLCVFTWLDHEGLATVPQVCKDWRQTSAADDLWRHHFYTRGFHETSPPRADERTPPAASMPSAERTAHQGAPGLAHPPPEGPQASGPGCETPRSKQGAGCGLWRGKYISAYEWSCHDCFSPTSRRTIAHAPLRFRLCCDCWAGYERARPEQRLATKREAMWAYRLRDSDLKELAYASDVNIVDPAFTSMSLFRKNDLRRAACIRWGGEEGFRRELVRSRRM